MGAAPRFQCAGCSRWIGKDRTHYAIPEVGVHCLGCAMTQQRGLVFNYRLADTPGTVQGTRAGIAAHLGLWPNTATRAAN